MESGLHVPGPPGGLRGRTSECALLDDLVSAIRRGESRSVVLRGEAGIGKTALLRTAERQAMDMRRLSARGAAMEAALPYAGLSELIGPVLPQLGALPVRHREAATSSVRHRALRSDAAQ